MQITPIVAALLLAASPGANAHAGEHVGSLSAVLAHLWTHADHWPGVVALLLATTGATLSLRRRSGAITPRHRE